MKGELAKMVEHIWPKNISTGNISQTIKRTREIITKNKLAACLMEVVRAPSVSSLLNALAGGILPCEAHEQVQVLRQLGVAWKAAKSLMLMLDKRR